MPAPKVHPWDLAAALAMSALALGLLVIAVPKLGPLPELPTSWNSLNDFLKEAAPWLIVFWSAASLALSYGWWKGARQAFGLGLVLNAAYLAISLVGSALFGITIHALFGSYAAVRLFSRR